MGSGVYSSSAFTSFSTPRGYHKSSTTVADVYKSRRLHADLNPTGFGHRESRDSAEHPASFPIIIALDVTGSMAPVLDKIARTGLKTLCEEIYARKPVDDPQICVMGIGDLDYDNAPIQMSQFESDIRIFESLEKLYLEQGGGSNDVESYPVAWLMALERVKADHIEKGRGRGLIVTIGDEKCPCELHLDAKVTGQGDRTVFVPRLFEDAGKDWDIYHIVIKEGNYARREFESVMKSWGDMIGLQHVLPLDKYEHIGETIVGLLELLSGKSLRDVTGSWSAETALSVSSALASVFASPEAHAAAIRALDKIV